MKRVFTVILGVIFLLLSASKIENTVQADRSYSISKYRIQIYVLKNGDANVTQKITYNFQGDFNGVNYKFDVAGTDGMTEPNVYFRQNGKTTELFENDWDSDDWYTIDGNLNKQKIDVYHQVTNDKVTFIYKYHVYGVVTNYQDTAELNWKIIGSGWDVPLNNVRINITFPQKNITDLRSWSHGPLTGYTDVNRKNGTVSLAVKQVPANQFVENRSIFPISVTPNNRKVRNKKVKKQVLQAEQEAAIEANETRMLHRYVAYGSIPVYVAIILTLMFLAYHFWKSGDAVKINSEKKLYHWFDPPKMKPSMARMILKKSDYPDQMGLLGDMMMESANGNLTITQNDDKYFVGKKTDRAEPYFNYVINEYGENDSVEISKITDFDNPDIYLQYQAWATRQASGREQYFNEKAQTVVKRMKTISVIAILISLFFVISDFFVMVQIAKVASAFAGLGIAGAIWLWNYANNKLSVYTTKGLQTANEIQAFRTMLLDIDDITLADVGDLILWEQILPFAVAFGVAKRVVVALQRTFGKGKVYQPIYMYSSNVIGDFSPQTDLGDIFSPYSDSTNSSTGGSGGFGGSSGGFSGGSSGGFGGGSGGGAF